MFQNRVKILLIFLMVASCLRVVAQLPYQNPALSFEQRAKDLMDRLTVEEKVSLLLDQSPAIPRLGVKKFNWWSEALHGLANNDSVTVFPEPIGMAASFNDQLVYRIFSAVSDEARAKYHQSLKKGQENRRFLSLSVWTPNINIFRDPRWGRGQETYGEDPYLTSRMGVAVVKGLQGPEEAKYRKLLACAKHFAVHSGPEWSRHELNLNQVNARDLWETYLPAFKSLVMDADVRQVMCAYHRLDDEPCCGNSRLLQRILRDEWGYRHLVVSDCGAITDFYSTHKVSSDTIHAASKALLSGTDVECVWQNYSFEKLTEAVNRGLVKVEDIDKALLRVLTGRLELGDFDNDSMVPWANIPPSVINNEAHRQLALQMALQSMTLLQNNNSVLPLKKTLENIAVIGPNADDESMLWGNYNGIPIRTVTILNGIRSKLGGSNVIYDKACDLVEDKVTNSYIPVAGHEGVRGLKAVYWNNRAFRGDTVTVQHITTPIKLTTAGQHEFATGVKLEDFSVLYETTFLASATEEIVFKYAAAGSFELLVNDSLLISYNNWRAIPSKMVFKLENGKSYKITVRYAQLNNWQANLEFDFGKEKDVDFAALIEKLKGVETVVFAGGLSTMLEGEEMPISYPGFKDGDRTEIELPAVQRHCLKALREAGKKVIFVNCSGSAIALVPETKSCDAILQAWYGGESGGQAVADVLFGDYNPSGKLPITFYKNLSQLGDFEDYSMKGRTYRFQPDPLFQFGFGLSYTSFSIGEALLSATELKAGQGLSLTVPVTNMGKRPGTEIVQVYIKKEADKESALKTLKAYQRVKVAKGKTVKVLIEIPAEAFEFFDTDSGKMKIQPGSYKLLYGNSSSDKDLKLATVVLK